MRSPIKLQTAFFLFLVLTLPVRLFAWDLLNVITGTSDYTISEDDIKIVPLINAKNIFEAINDLSICRKKEVRRFIHIYLTQGRKFTKRAILNSYTYKSIIDTVVEKVDNLKLDLR